MTIKIDLSNLGLKEVETINDRPKVFILNSNKITKIDKLSTHTQLQQLSISGNQIIQTNGLSHLSNLTVLDLSHNKIISIDGIKSLNMLTWLNLSNNRIKNIEHLEGNLQLKHLDLSDNLITKISNISFLSKLKTFLMHGNRITSLYRIDLFLNISIEILSLAENQIHDLTEISYLHSLFNLKQLSIKENPCLMKSSSEMEFDYRPYIINWCIDLKILDGEEINEKEKLIAEWLYTQGKGRIYKPGDHFELVNYLTKDCAFTNLKNKSKLKNDLDNILEQRKQLSSRKILSSRTNNNESDKDTTKFSSSKSRKLSNNLDDTDLNVSISLSANGNDTTNTSLLISDSLFLPIKPVNQSPSPKKSISPVIRQKSNSIDSSYVPILKFSKENPKLCSKNTSKSILNSSLDESNSVVNDISYTKKDLFIRKYREESKNKVLPDQSNNSNSEQSKIKLNKIINSVIRIQAWWRSISTRLKNPIVRRYLSGREANRTRSHILFLQKQMQLYYESYEQQRKLNISQNQAIQFLLDQVKELTIWKEKFENDNKSQNSNKKETNESKKEISTQFSQDINESVKEQLLNKIDNLEEQVTTLKESMWKIETAVHLYDENSRNDQNSPIISESICSEEGDLNRVIYEVEKIYRNGTGKHSSNELESDNESFPMNDEELQTLRHIDNAPANSSEIQDDK
uniref:Centrosomal protein of 97 kDa n=1 Tax=Schmidtea mediterranea TaxID=79327 RepID=H6WA36_SCHMD|nr:CEP97 [Schmidtea mediterranea]